MALTLSRIDRLSRSHDATARFPSLTVTGVDVALLPPRSTPTAATVWTAATYAAGTATVLLAGPDADSAGALVVSASADLWMRVTDAPEVDAEYIERITVLGAGSLAPLPSVHVASVAGLTGAVTAASLVDALDAAGGVVPSGGAGGALSGTYPNPGLNVTAVDNATAALVDDTGTATGAALAAALAPLERPKLRRWYAALANREAAPAQIVCWGDSITEGTGATLLRRRWQTLLQKILRTRYGVTSGATFPYIPAWYATTAGGTPVSESGTVYHDPYGGLGTRVGIIDTGSVTFSFTGTRAKLVVTKGPSTGSARVVIDGGSAVILNTNDPGATLGGALLDLGALTAGAHTVTVSQEATTGSIFLEGLLTFDGDESAGIRVLDAGHHGVTSTSVTGSQATYQAASLAGVGGAGLAIIALGTNDVTSGVTAAQMKTNLAAFVTALRAAGFAGSVLYLATFKAGVTSNATWDPYVTAMRELADADADAEFLDLGGRMIEPQAVEPDAASLGLYADTVHPSDAGHGWMADVLAGFIAHA